jgi:hypothetical protein
MKTTLPEGTDKQTFFKKIIWFVFDGIFETFWVPEAGFKRGDFPI